VDFIAFILEYLVIDVCRHDVASRSYSSLSYFVLAVLALGEGDATGEGLAAWLALFTGALSVARLGEVDADGEGLATAGEFELLPGSQPTANMIENVVRSASAVRLIRLMFAVVIVFFLVPARLKSWTIIARSPISSNGCSHISFAEISARAAPKPSFSKRGLHY